MSDFAEKLSVLVSLHSTEATAEEAGAMIERLAHALGFAIAMTTGGDETKMNNMLEGASNYMYEVAAGMKNLGKVIGGVRG